MNGLKDVGRLVVGCGLLLALVGCSAVQNSPTPEQDAQRAVAAVKVALTGAYTTAADLLQAGVLSPGDARSVYVNLSRAEAALSTAETQIASNPTSAQAYINTALQITTDVLADLQKVQGVPPKTITNGSGGV